MSQHRVRVTKFPGVGPTYWFWICKIRNSGGQADPWCLRQSLAMEYPSHADAIAAAVEHLRHHDRTGDRTLTYEDFMAMVESA